MHSKACQPMRQRSVKKRHSELPRWQMVEETQLDQAGMRTERSEEAGDQGSIVTRAVQRETAQRCEPAYAATLVKEVHTGLLNSHVRDHSNPCVLCTLSWCGRQP